MSTKVIVVRPGSLDPAAKKVLLKEGYAVVEHPYPNDIKIIDSANESIILEAALEALSAIGVGNSIKADFADRVTKKLLAQKKPTK